MNDFLADVDTVITIYFLDFVNGDDVGAMHSQKLFLGQHLLNGFHRQMGDQWLGLVVEIKPPQQVPARKRKSKANHMPLPHREL